MVTEAMKRAELDCIPFTEYIPNECWKKVAFGTDLGIMWITLPSCSEIAKVLVINRLEKMELVFTKVNSTITIRDNCLCYHKSNLIRIDKL